MKRLNLLGSLTLAAALGSLAGCSNPEVPAGHEGYVFYTPLIFGQMEFRDDLRGPATTGVSWRLDTINIDMRASSYKEDFQLLTSENLTVTFEVNTRLRLRPGTVKNIVEDWGGINWYEWNVKERLRTIVREQVTEFSALAIQLETPKVRAQIEDTLREQLEIDPRTGKPSPILIESVDVGEIHFPKEVAEAIERKIATKQELERQRYVLAKTVEEANEKVLNAIGEAKQQLTISSTLDPLYVQYRAIQAYRKLAKSNNQTTIVLPNSTKGTALPLVLQPDARRVFSTSDKKRIDDTLDALEKEMKIKADALVLELANPVDVDALPDAPEEDVVPADTPPADTPPADTPPAETPPAPAGTEAAPATP
jgi:regulator of protease activity HflC (stomatin/prohibitin superfamily)